jgi:peptide deformylase
LATAGAKRRRWDEDWKPINLRVTGTDARVVSHEVDHLDGVLFLDYLDEQSRLFIAHRDDNGEEKLVEIPNPISS